MGARQHIKMKLNTQNPPLNHDMTQVIDRVDEAYVSTLDPRGTRH